MRKRKYRPGRLITSLDDLAAQEFVYWNDKITHHGWVMSWQMHMAQQAIQAGIIRAAERIDTDAGANDDSAAGAEGI